MLHTRRNFFPEYHFSSQEPSPPYLDSLRPGSWMDLGVGQIVWSGYSWVHWSLCPPPEPTFVELASFTNAH